MFQSRLLILKSIVKFLSPQEQGSEEDDRLLHTGFFRPSFVEQRYYDYFVDALRVCPDQSKGRLGEPSQTGPSTSTFIHNYDFLEDHSSTSPSLSTINQSVEELISPSRSSQTISSVSMLYPCLEAASLEAAPAAFSPMSSRELDVETIYATMSIARLLKTDDSKSLATFVNRLSAYFPFGSQTVAKQDLKVLKQNNYITFRFRI
jgi:hypothetical protein